MTIEGHKFKLRTESSLENLSVISTFVSEAMKRAEIDATIIPKVLMAVDEACTNIMQYAYSEGKGFIRLACWLERDDFVISIEDEGMPFNPCSVPSPELDANLDDRRVGGLGTYFMRKFMDKISYKYDPKTGNQLTMRKHVGADDRGDE
jgi:anti-sigma regulatory factor (Ser/Thr protein kinase)